MSNDPINLNDPTGEWPDWDLDDFQGALDVVSMVAGSVGLYHIAAAATAVNVIVSVSRGNYQDALIRASYIAGGAVAGKIIGKVAQASQKVAKAVQKVQQVQQKVVQKMGKVGKVLTNADKAIGKGINKAAGAVGGAMKSAISKASGATKQLITKVKGPKSNLGETKGTNKASDLNKSNNNVSENGTGETKTPAQQLKEKKAATFEQSKQNGAEAHQKTTDQLKGNPDEQLIGEEIKLKPKTANANGETPATRADHIVIDKADGKAIIYETKSSTTAPLSSGQKNAADIVKRGDGLFEIRSDKLKAFGYNKGDVLEVKEYRVLYQKLDAASKK